MTGAGAREEAEEPDVAGASPEPWDQALDIATPLLHPWLHHRLAVVPGEEGPPGSGAEGSCGGPGSGRVPGQVLDRLAAARRASALLHLRRKEELRAILAAFGRSGIPVVVLKGMALACLVYPDPALRPMLDLDLLVPGESVAAGRTILHDLGFRVPIRHAFRPESGATAMAESSKPMQRPGTRMMVDLHGESLLDRGAGIAGGAGRVGVDPGGAARILERAAPADLDGVRALVPSLEDLLVHVCLHLSRRHLFDRGLPPLLDLSLLLQRRAGAMAWDEIARHASAPGGREGILLPLKLARDLLGAPLAPDQDRRAPREDVPRGPIPPAPDRRPPGTDARREPFPPVSGSRVLEDLLRDWPEDARLREVERLAIEQVLRTGRDHVSPGLVELAMQPRTMRLGHLLRRLNPWRREDRGRGSAAAARAGAMAARRMGADLLTRARIYIGAWRRGDLSRASLDRAIHLRRGRDRIAEILAATERESRDQNPMR